ncbi:integrase, catalytic region, zinc finger, CCHC-type containing protein [Tanacetum coccineum]|uniref:Integrase, catalytic region, zinc finger, CCHC-type containing protein n=1 Tax=Tanacetum coccineum TaxID=301880 RepID=A0ABQ5J076_9ASTR
MILESVENGPLIWPTVEENGVIKRKKYAELSAAEKIQAKCDMKDTNIILQGLPADIYSLVNHHRVAKDLWERVQLLMQGTSLTKQERECKLYDAFNKFTHIKGETLHNLPLEWSKFVTDVKLLKELHIMNFDQLHAYLEQHELHANEVHLLRERNQDPLPFVANQQMTPPHFNTYHSSYNNSQLQQQFSPSQFGSIHPNQHYSSTYPSQPQFNHSSVLSSYPYQSQMNHQTSSVPQIAYSSPQVTTQPMTESPLMDSSFTILVFSLGDDLIFSGSISINRGLIQAISTSLPPHPIGKATKASSLQRIPPEGQILRELRKISFSGGPTDSAVEHISNVLEIASMFNAQESTLVQQNFIRRFCPPAMIFKQLSEIQNFKQEDGESLFDTWERYNDLLFKCPFHDLNDYQKVNTFYNGLNNQTRQTVNTNGLIPGLTTLDHKWHCEENYTTTPDTLRIITEKLKLLNHEIEELTVDFRKLNTDDVRKSYYAKISLGVGNDQVVFNINKKESPAFISPICVISEVDKTQELNDLVMNDEKVRDFENYLSPEYGSQDIISLSPSELAKDKEEFSMTLGDPDKRMSIGLEEFVDIDDIWDDLDLGILSNEKATTEFVGNYRFDETKETSNETKGSKSVRCAQFFMEQTQQDLKTQGIGDCFVIIEDAADGETKKLFLEENKEATATHDKPKQQLQKVVSHEIKESPTHYSVTHQNKLPPKEIDPVSFIIPCIISNHSMSNALADLGASISIMPYSFFKRLGLGSLKPIKMTIEMADRSMQSPKGIKENVLVKISNLVFPVDFIVLDIMEDENVPIILGRPMLAIAHAKIDVYGKKIYLGVGNDQVIFNINKKESPTSISPICVINEVDKTQELNDLVMNDKKVRDFENYLSPEYESEDIISLSPSELTEDKEEFSMTLGDPDKRMSIGLEEFVDINDMG